MIDLDARTMTLNVAPQVVQADGGPFEVMLDRMMVSCPVGTARAVLAGTVMLVSRQAVS